eukprot:CAMPEP_0182522888 /NCGR_PEP_ID=MMETSP1323-20130603/634_1 /TAXON_ID=236787 /ORGANISM="Florenciella parvula, Strain RCC1693" /LENGTH=111 /DNA_ID=CAMNT_0024731125 /DNA_START=53 /DNA_END=388 /DNA_ORIENTATION=-
MGEYDIEWDEVEDENWAAEAAKQGGAAAAAAAGAKAAAAAVPEIPDDGMWPFVVALLMAASGVMFLLLSQPIASTAPPVAVLEGAKGKAKPGKAKAKAEAKPAEADMNELD